ncbi:FUSC family protein [Micromonospora sp. WMMD1076]|uniref:FUSC family protein n=1 Tax=Micromonospora sp. WMMD1076 TaxID=3016103 RepID=UPI00249B329D|nr:FUSC family protein [Micromonospora sp. WMMD1076]WFF04507.1 FUSC family protein [Micromonospora sp. WMMD1076]
MQTYFILAVQAGLAAALAWLAARGLLGKEDPTFAPAAAVGVIASAIGNHARRAVELVSGVGLGVLVGDLLIGATGTGAWQTGVIVFVAIAIAAAVRGTGALMVQAGGTGVLVATVSPTNPDLELPRTLNALIGGAIGLLVVLIIVPLNPMRTLRRVADPALGTFAAYMTTAAQALACRDACAADELLDEMRAAEPELDRLDEVVIAADEVARHSPLRWRRRRALAAYSQGVEHMERAFRNSRTLVRRLGTAVREKEPVPFELPAAIELYGEAIRMLHREYLTTKEPVGARERVLAAVREAGKACRQDIGFCGTIVVSQLRTIANDLLRATGVPRNEARRMVRRAAAGYG